MKESSLGREKELAGKSTMKHTHRLNVLVSAYACNPEGSLQLHPGEDLTGWELLKQLSRFYNLWVLTHRYNEKGIRSVLSRLDLPHVHFFFLELPSYLKWLYGIEFAQRIYYYFWQFKAWHVARKLRRKIFFQASQHLTFGNFWMPSFIGAFLKVPFIWGPVGGGQRTPRPLLKEYSFYGVLAEKFRGVAQWIGLHLLISRWLCLKRAKAILVCNLETKGRIPAKYFDKIQLFPVNGISRDDLIVKKPLSSHRKKTFRILTSGRFIRLKGFSLAIRAFSLFVKKYSQAILEVVGSGPEEKRLRELVSHLNIQDKVVFPGWLPRESVLCRMRESDLFLFPSFRDGGGAVVVEAMASGLPIVVLDSGGPSFHAMGDWGIKIKPGNPDQVASDIAEVLEKLFLDRRLCREMGQAARNRAEDYYLWNKLGDRLQEIYSKIVVPKDI